MKVAREAEKEAPTKETVLDLFLVFTEIVLQLGDREAKTEVKSIIQLFFDDSFDADELRGHVKEVERCKQVLNDSGVEEQAKNVFTKNTVGSGSDSSASQKVLYKKGVVGSFRRQKAMGSSQDVLSARQIFRSGQGILLVRELARKHRRRCHKA